MTTRMTEKAPDRRSLELSGLLLTQLERTQTAANLLLDTWRPNTLSAFDRLPERPSCLERTFVCQ